VFDSNPGPGDAGPVASLRRFGAPIGVVMIAVTLIVGFVFIRSALGEEDPPLAVPPESSAPERATPSTAEPGTTEVPAAPGTTAAGAPRPVTGPHCTFTKGVTESCQSDDPSIDLRVVFASDARQCSFENTVDWGDGSPSERTAVAGGSAGARRVSSHTYHRTGRFAVRQSVRLVAGSCRAYEGSYSFSLID
jgi:hypothetical protein